MRPAPADRGRGRPPRLRRALTLALLLLLAVFFALLAHRLSLGNFIDGLGQPKGRVQAGALPGLDWEERWRQQPEDALSYWACESARFAHGFAAGSLRFENPPTSPYHLVFELSVEMRGKAAVIYRSPSLPPGNYLDGDKLARALEPGEYQAVCLVYAYEPGASGPCARSQGQRMAIRVEK